MYFLWKVRRHLHFYPFNTKNLIETKLVYKKISRISKSLQFFVNGLPSKETPKIVEIK